MPEVFCWVRIAKNGARADLVGGGQLDVEGGTQVMVIARSNDRSWYLVVMPDNVQGWLHHVDFDQDSIQFEYCEGLPPQARGNLPLTWFPRRPKE